jgi:hypothetical protein
MLRVAEALDLQTFNSVSTKKALVFRITCLSIVLDEIFSRESARVGLLWRRCQLEMAEKRKYTYKSQHQFGMQVGHAG